jgi:hypothetical protein
VAEQAAPQAVSSNHAFFHNLLEVVMHMGFSIFCTTGQLVLWQTLECALLQQQWMHLCDVLVAAAAARAFASLLPTVRGLTVGKMQLVQLIAVFCA